MVLYVMQSGKFVLRIPPPLHTQLRNRALSENKSLNRICCEILQGVETPLSDLIRLNSNTPGWTQIVLNKLQSIGISCNGLILFGSAARNQMQNNSDLDLMIVVDESIPITRDLYRVWEKKIGAAIDQRVSPHFSHLPRAPLEATGLWYEIAMDGIILFDSGRRVHAFLKLIRYAIAEGHLIRRVSHGHPYWVRKGK